jgi:hypothetical protein
MKQIEQRKIETILEEFAKLYNQANIDEERQSADSCAFKYITINSEPHFKSHFVSYYYWQKRKEKK